jgi:hypothetical protein
MWLLSGQSTQHSRYQYVPTLHDLNLLDSDCITLPVEYDDDWALGWLYVPDESNPTTAEGACVAPYAVELKTICDERCGGGG